MSHLVPLYGTFACSSMMAIGGVTLAFMGREANLAGDMGSVLGNANPISVFTRISLIVTASLRSYGIYPYELALICTLVGTVIAISTVYLLTRHHQYKMSVAYLLALPILAGALVVYVGMPTFSTVTHEIVAL